MLSKYLRTNRQWSIALASFNREDLLESLGEPVRCSRQERRTKILPTGKRQLQTTLRRTRASLASLYAGLAASTRASNECNRDQQLSAGRHNPRLRRPLALDLVRGALGPVRKRGDVAPMNGLVSASRDEPKSLGIPAAER